MREIRAQGRLRLYDVSLDEFRDVTQADVDRMETIVQAYGRLRSAFKDTHEWAMQSVNNLPRSTP